MRIAVSGKGGTGKTTIAGTLSRLLGQRGLQVLALDADSNPNLAIALGLPQEASGAIRGLPPTLAEWHQDTQGEAYVKLTRPLKEVEREYGVAAPDQVTLLVMGTVDHAGVGCRCSAHSAARGIMAYLLQSNGRPVIADMEAGLEHLGRGTVKHADALLVVVEPYYRALEAGRRIQQLAVELGVPRIYAVANKIRNGAEEEAVRTFCSRHQIRLLGTLPFDEQVRVAEGEERGLLDIAPGSPLVTAIRNLLDSLVQETA